MKPALMKPFNVQRQFNDAGSLGKIEIVPMDVSDLSCGESVCSSKKNSMVGSADFSRRLPRNERSIPRNERVSRKDRTKKRQSRRQRLEEELKNDCDNSSCDEFEPAPAPRLRRASTVDNTAFRRERHLNMSAPVAPLRRSSTGPVEVTTTRRLRRSGTGPTHTSTAPLTTPLSMPYGPLAPLAPSVPQRRASIRCSSIPEHMDDTSETVATTDHEDSGYEQYAYVYKPDRQSYEPVPVRMRRQRTGEQGNQPSRALRADPQPMRPMMMRQCTPDIRQQGAVRTLRSSNPNNDATTTNAAQVHIHTQGDVHVHSRPIAGMTTNSSNAGTPPQQLQQPQPRQRRTSRKDRIQASKRASDPSIVIMNPHDLLTNIQEVQEVPPPMPSLGYRRTSTVDNSAVIMNPHDLSSKDRHSERLERKIPNLAPFRRSSTVDCTLDLKNLEQQVKACECNCAANEPSRPLYKRNRNASDPGFHRTSTMDSLPSKPRRRESMANGASSSAGLQRTRSQSLHEKKRWN